MSKSGQADRLTHVLAAIDAANACDPGKDLPSGRPAAQLYGERMSARLDTFAPQADDPLRIAVRGQHLERWSIPRKDFPMDRAGYLRWRNVLKDRHADRLAALMSDAGYEEASIARTRQIVRKERLKLDPDAQTLEDVACLVFLEHYAEDFAGKHELAKVVDIVAKTWRKMSPHGQEVALTLPLPPPVTSVVTQALGERRA